MFIFIRLLLWEICDVLFKIKKSSEHVSELLLDSPIVYLFIASQSVN